MHVKKSRPLIGIVGGMGTVAGLHFQNLFFQLCNDKGIDTDQDYPEWLYFNAAKAPDRTEALKNIGSSPTEYVITVLKKMEAAGVDFVVVVCNTVHSFYEDIRKEVSIPWIHLPRETARIIHKEGYSSVALMSTEGTLISGIFRDAIKPLKIKYHELYPDSELQAKITSAIFDKIFGIKSTGTGINNKALKMLKDVIDQFEDDAIIAGCTELSFAFSKMNLDREWLNPVQIAANTCFEIWNGERSMDSLTDLVNSGINK